MIATTLLSLALATHAAARPPLPPSERTPQAEQWLARAFVGEAGWMQKRAHAGIAFVLARRWRRMVRRWPEMRFETVIKNYAHALGFRRRGSPTNRQLWLRELVGDARPEHWPRRSRWERHVRLWSAAQKRASKWFDGRIKDPCGGRAEHWGGTVDLPLARQKRLRPLDCGDTGRTTFYELGARDE